ncbi:MAG TPA: PEP-CTERM sorting domain-containing protein [Phycisphaerae bacterium]|nr:PEP-CTERM sorting domain-containing protein [Phycisphaerae bacterium]
MSTWARVTSLVLVLQVALAAGAQGAIITFQLDHEFSGGTPPAGLAPWLTATFDDGSDLTDGIVTLTLAATNLTGSEKTKEWYLNLDPVLTPGDLEFTVASKTGAFDDPTISRGTNAYQAGSDGEYDILFAFTHSGPAMKTFGEGDSIQYTVRLIGSTALGAGSFDFLSEPAGGHGPYSTAAHVQSIGPDEDSGWVTVPEPASVGLLALGLGAVAALRRRAGK